ncbi:MAG: hypothetical protein BM557_06400 [Flavobacterium sp. MedPE-SWcel]|mgnify:CR=1 FL=1|uniref:hypothetical protein n=1 Tax=uncultured Flavobacterium sp. TaxID=165435 RepID=UPI0009207F67|nr:hypothetical protein [uncultured Flavobacterium sp.]OIQ19330.1 MAG: hypothetical protein BM557_06400 [Flavobacterium sp. MedPE-SWcel]
MSETLNDLIEKSKQESTSIEDLKHEVAKIMGSSEHIYKTHIHKDFEPQGLYRAREHNHIEGKLKYEGKLQKFISETEFWNAPEEHCNLGRCNDKGESLFYCTNEFEVAIQEIKPRKTHAAGSVAEQYKITERTMFNIISFMEGS